jgi:NNP family nitrate/nitrite transporter-like MFS transporter
VNSFVGTLALGVMLGFAGASFAIALPLASRWYPPEHQGKAMGLAGMGNSGTVSPRCSRRCSPSCSAGMRCSASPASRCRSSSVTLSGDGEGCAERARAAQPMAAYLQPLKVADAWWLMAFYSVTFGGFSGSPRRCPSTSPTSSG